MRRFRGYLVCSFVVFLVSCKPQEPDFTSAVKIWAADRYKSEFFSVKQVEIEKANNTLSDPRNSGKIYSFKVTFVPKVDLYDSPQFAGGVQYDKETGRYGYSKLENTQRKLVATPSDGREFSIYGSVAASKQIDRIDIVQISEDKRDLPKVWPLSDKTRQK